MSTQTSNEALLLEQLLSAAVEDRARILGTGPEAAAALAGLINHAACMTLADAAKADVASDALVNLADRCGSQLDRARARRARARTLSYAGRFHEALTTCAEGLRLAKEAGDSIEAGRAQLASMHALGELGRLDEAIAAGEAARQAFLAAGEAALAARADLNIGTVHQRRDDPATALRYFDRARPSLVSEPAVLGPLDNNRGEALMALNDFAGAERAYGVALENFRSGNASMAAAIVESNLADVATRQGRLQKAMQHFEHARRALEGGASPAHLARLFAEQAEVLALLGMTEESVREFERALTELDRHGLALEAARARAGLGTALLRLGRLAAAETALAAAATAFDELKHETARARIDLRRAELAQLNGRLADGRAMALRALSVLHDRSAEAAAAHLVLAGLLVAENRLNEAEAEFNHAHALASRMRVAPLLAEIRQQRGSLRRALGRLDEAVADLQAAAEEIERVRGSIHADRFRAAFLGDRASVYEDLVTTLLDRDAPGDVAAAFTAAEAAKSRSLADALQRDLLQDAEGPAPEAPDEHTAQLLRRLRVARANLDGLYSVLGDERRAAGGEAAWRDRVRQTEQELDELEARLATTASSSGSAIVFAPAVDTAQIASMLEHDAAMVEYFVAGDEIIAFVLRHDGLSVMRRVGSLAAVASHMQALQFQITRALRPGALSADRGQRLIRDTQLVLADLAAEVLDRIATRLAGTRHLVLVPHGILHMLPYHALPLNGRVLAHTHSASFAPSARMFVALAGRDRPGNLMSRPVVVGVADEHAPDIDVEARSVGKQFGSSSDRVLLNADATVQRVLAGMADASIIHLACHGRYAPESPMSSGMRLWDRWLTARDLMQLRLGAQLVTLSGCETGVNLVKAGDELLGMLRGFFVAGAPRVLASLWRIDDASTREFMAAFYGCLNRLDAEESDPWIVAEAMRQAQLRLMQTQPHPALWASFVLAGRP